MKASFKILALTVLVLISGNLAFSQDSAGNNTSQSKELPKNGILATTQGGSGGITVDSLWGDKGVTSSDSAPISGSVSQLGWNEWVMKVFNTSQDDYRVTVRVVQYGDKGRQIGSSPFTFTLKAGQSAQRSVKTSPLVKNCSLEMRNWKNLSEEKRKQENNNTVEGTVEE